MASIYDIKPQFQQLLRPIVNRLAKTGVTPNQVTVAAMMLSIMTGFILMIFYEHSYILFLVPIVMFIRMALNAIDGMLAKEHQMMTKLGNILNEIGDVVSDAMLLLPFAFITGFYAPLLVLIVVCAIISEMAGVLGVVIGASRRYDGPMGKSDRAFVFGLLAIFGAFNLLPTLWNTVVLSIVLLLIIINIMIRIRRALKEVDEIGV
ncbi:CDP-alcohol phosphatidyltransferase family protein [Pseudogracilibacillus auburnensis]|uniref:CDP-diacylglycerol--glycerol-3-phosphate 3-phosphatidyltransferase n=1 Tax=Pseudogracilibacillus auburnensis TaxID=1494959 RepID=A0A2V3W761_9BACI|nr:CDP-alcohol phosphatidyltransferase family protein [Pseudogracilibacillus auburnensis]PXW90203.1 CDP-diacylglycerol--glycerol-3-phosphate 3-phosphatidyltransferase [Pseudogracilibacillus auburnensis]